METKTKKGEKLQGMRGKKENTEIGERSSKKLQWIKECLLQSLYPRRCPICQQIIEERGGLACPECRRKLRYVKEPRCKKCGKPIERMEQEYCFDCGKKHRFYIQGAAVWIYDEQMKRSIYQFKYHNRREYADFYVQEILREYGGLIREWKADVLIPIPLHASRKRKRGFNQAEVLSRKLGQVLNLPVDAKSLKRVKKTVPQKELNDLNRMRNLKNAFKICGNKVKLKYVILVDDIYTTGSTIEEAAKVLLEHGARGVYFISLCIGRGV